jgi:hypothetical protein
MSTTIFCYPDYARFPHNRSCSLYNVGYAYLISPLPGLPNKAKKGKCNNDPPGDKLL